MELINSLVDDFFSLPPVAVLLISWAIMPGGMFLVAWIGESRILQIGKGQSKMFFPGDLMIGVMLSQVAILQQAGVSAEWTWVRSWWLIPAIGIPVFSFSLQRFVTDAPRYAPRSRNSPTKWYHDVAGYLVCSFLLAVRGIPELLYMITHLGAAWRDFGFSWAIILAAGGFYLGCAAYDALHSKTAPEGVEDAFAWLTEQRHPSDWQPIWRKH